MRYVMYKGEKPVATGTAREIAEKMGVSVKTVYWYASPAAKRRTKNGTVVERAE